MTHCLTFKKFEQLWFGNIDNTISDDKRVTLYWNHRPKYTPLVTLYRFAHRGVLSKNNSKVDIISLCASCTFVMAHHYGWLTKPKNNQTISNIYKEKTGSGISWDHIVSHQLGLIPHSTGKSTHDKFWGSVLNVDHFSDF